MHARGLAMVVRGLGILLLAAVFLPSLIHHVVSAEDLIPATDSALAGLLGRPVGREVSEVVYWASSALLLGGPLLVLGVFSAALRKLGALLLLTFLAGVTPTMHAFWAQKEQSEQQAHMVHFLKNISLMGALLLVLTEPTPPARNNNTGRGTSHKQQQQQQQKKKKRN